MSEPALAEDIGDRFDHVLVDEYQDTNRLQSSILLALKPGGYGLAVVGDDAQSIYSFQAATVRNILDFPGQFSPPANVITPSRNYRSTQPIWPPRQRVIDLAKERFTRILWTDRTSGMKPQLVHCARRSRPGPLHRRAYPGKSRGGHAPEASGGAVPDIQPQRFIGSRVSPTKTSHSSSSVVSRISRCRAREGHGCVAALR